MLKVRILCVGKLKESYWRNACEEYAKRLSAFCRFSIQEIPETRLPENPSPALIEAALREEGKKLLEAAGDDILFPLCIEGTKLTSEQLSETIEETAIYGESSLSFVIGSSYGLHEDVKRKGKKRISMSAMTFPHQLARVMLCEQIYRAFQIAAHTRYHK